MTKPTIKLKDMNLWEAQQARRWRNRAREMLRTPFLLTEKMQEDFYYSLARDARMRYFAVYDDEKFIGMGGLVNIEWENRLAEVSLIMAPEVRKKGYGAVAVTLLLNEGFNNMNLANIYGECYLCNPAVEFWRKMGDKYGAVFLRLPNRKYWGGKYYDSLYFNFGGEQFGFNGDSQQGNTENGRAGP